MSTARHDLKEYIWNLKLKARSLEEELESFKSGNVYIKLRSDYESVIRGKNAEIRRLKLELARSHAQIIINRDNFFDVIKDMEKEHAKEIAVKDREISELKERNLEVERQRDAALDEVTAVSREKETLITELEEERGKNRKLTAQVNKDFENSSIPSSAQGPGRKKVHNSREKSVKKPGGQPGHKGRRLVQQEPTETEMLPDPEEYVNDPKYYPTGEEVSKQKIILTVGVIIKEIRARVYKNKETGSRVHAEFPDGYEKDISYDPSVKALAFLLSCHGNMAAEKICSILHEVSDGKISISKATVLGLCREFSEKSEQEKQEIINDLMSHPVMNVDFTNANVNGDGKQVLITASPDSGATLFSARDNKGHKGIQGTPLENYVGIAVHDHDTTYYSYASAHQECMQHNIRYLIGSEENEQELKWNRKMHKLIQKMLHYKNSLNGKESDPDIVSRYETRYDRILEMAGKEYEKHPPSDYYRDGYNLYLRLMKYKDSELRFLHDPKVPANNSLAERLARTYKRKQKQMIVIRSDDNFVYLCNSLSVLTTLRYKDETNLYQKTKDIFSRKRKQKKESESG